MPIQFSPNVTDDVRFAVCILRNFHWSRGDMDQSNFSALVAVKEAVLNNSCSWVRLIWHRRVHCLLMFAFNIAAIIVTRYVLFV